MEGQVLGNRYELLEKIGGGGMALVYKAKCKLLNRNVAVKILRTEFTNDEEFVKRFVVEDQSAASLSHPNIVSIYDVGHEGNIHYIVMEYVNGITLKEYITKRGALEWRDAINIAIQICSAIEHAHSNHIVHRDIKPHNILLTKDGIAKVTDFGIARAVSASTITMAGSTIGSVHYFSPEQARGGYVDEKSDIYSLGITLYEMATGRIPFDGETPVAVALKHLQVEAEAPLHINHTLPRGINDIVMKAIRKEQNKRYQTASAMLQDLYRVVKEPNGSFNTEESVEDSPTRRIRAISSEELGLKPDYTGDEKEGEKQVKKKDRFTIGLAVATSIIIISIFMFVTYYIVAREQPSGGKAASTDFVVRSYVGRDINEVRAELEKASINVDIIRKNDDKVNKDQILSQRIDVGKKLKPGSTIGFDVSDGPHMVKIADLRKVEARTAETTLKSLGLLTRINEEYHDTIASGFVIKTEPKEGEQVKVGEVVTIYKSMGPELKETEVPNLVGLTKDQSMKAIADAKLKIGKIIPENSSNVVAKVVRQEPEAKSKVKEDTAVNIYFETSPAPTSSPSSTSNPGSSSNPASTSGPRKMTTEKINLINPQGYPDKMMVKVEIIPSDTNKPEIVMEEMKSKSDFPITVSIPVPDKGTSKVRIYLNNSTTPYVEFPKS